MNGWEYWCEVQGWDRLETMAGKMDMGDQEELPTVMAELSCGVDINWNDVKKAPEHGAHSKEQE